MQPNQESTTAPVSDADLAELTALLPRITALPWMHHKEEDEDEPHAVVQFPGYGPQIGLRYIAEVTLRADKAAADADYITAACNALPSLLARLAAAEAKAVAINEALTEAEQAREEELRSYQAKAALGHFIPSSSGYAAHMGELINIINKLRRPVLPQTVKGAGHA